MKIAKHNDIPKPWDQLLLQSDEYANNKKCIHITEQLRHTKNEEIERERVRVRNGANENETKKIQSLML